MAKYNYTFRGRDSDDFKITLLEHIANELAERNRLKRLQLILDYKDKDNEELYDLISQIEDKA